MLTAEQRDVQRLARDLAEREIAPRAADWDRDGAFDQAVLDELAALGFLGMRTPEAHGGLGLDVPACLVALEELAKADASLALAVAVQNAPLPQLLLDLGTEAQKRQWLPSLASGEARAGLALSEAGAALDASSLATTARQAPDGSWTLAGEEPWVAGGASASVVAVFARVEEDGAGPRVGVFMVDPAAQGCRVEPRETTMGCRAAGPAALHFDDARMDAGRALGRPAPGFGHVQGALDLGRLAGGARALGIAQAAMDHARAYALERQQFGRALVQFGAVRSKLAVMAARIEAARALVLDGGRLWEAGGESPQAGQDRLARSAMAKLVASETAAWVASQAVNVLGGNGYMKDFPVEKLMRDAHGTEILEGTNETMRLVVGRCVTEPRFGETT